MNSQNVVQKFAFGKANNFYVALLLACLAMTGGLVEYVMVFLESLSSIKSECSSCRLIWSIVEAWIKSITE